MPKRSRSTAPIELDPADPSHQNAIHEAGHALLCTLTVELRQIDATLQNLERSRLLGE